MVDVLELYVKSGGVAEIVLIRVVDWDLSRVHRCAN